MLGQQENTSSYNFNIKTLFLFVILICACCLLSIGYNWDINELFSNSTSMCACCILVLFLFYVLYEFFKSNTCDDSGEQKFADFSKLSSAMGRGRSYVGQKGTQGMMSMGNALNSASQGMSNYLNRGQQYGYVPQQQLNM